MKNSELAVTHRAKEARCVILRTGACGSCEIPVKNRAKEARFLTLRAGFYRILRKTLAVFLKKNSELRHSGIF